MTMPASPNTLNMAGTSSPVSVAYELGLGLTTTISMNQAAVRTLAGVGGSGTTWSMSSLWGKSSFAVSLAQLSGVTFDGFPIYEQESYSVTLGFYSDGTWQWNGYAAGIASGNWGTPTTTNIGSNYWVRWTRTAFYNSGGSNSASPSSGWQQLSTTRTITVSTIGLSVPSATYTIEISSDSGGSVVLASVSTTLQAQIFPG